MRTQDPPAARPPSLRVILRDLQADLDEAAAANLGHRREHGCREGACELGSVLAARVSDLLGRLAMTRFVNEEG